MNSEINRTCKILDEISVELSLYNKYLHEALLTKFISDRLEASLRYYAIDIDQSASFLSTRYGSEMLKSIAAKAKKANKQSVKLYSESEKEIFND